MTRTSLFAAGFTSLLALGATACGESSGADPRGTIHISVRDTDQTISGMSCTSPFPMTAFLPNDGDLLPNETATGVAYTSGENDMTVSCKVAKSGGGYTVDLQIDDGNTSLSLRGTLDGNGAGSALSGTMSDVDWLSNNALRSTSPNAQTCTLTASGGAYFIKSGSIYGAFDCPTLTNAPAIACHVTGYLFFERCAG